jgi:hypothetical protein
MTVRALVERLESKLGQPALPRDFPQQKLVCEWTIGTAAKVGVVEFVGSAERDFILHFSRNRRLPGYRTPSGADCWWFDAALRGGQTPHPGGLPTVARLRGRTIANPWRNTRRSPLAATDRREQGARDIGCMRLERNTEYGRQQQDGRHVVTVHRRVSDGVFTTVRMTYPSKDHDRWRPRSRAP